MDSIKFGSNYNNKFFNNSFIAVRKSNSIYKVGSSFLIEVRSTKRPEIFLDFGAAKLVSLTTIDFSELTETHSFLDMNLPLRQYESFLIKTYRRFGVSIKQEKLDVIVFQYLNSLENKI